MFKKKVPKPSRPDGAAPGKTGGDGAPPGPPGGIPPHLRPQEAKKGAPPPGAPPPNAIKPGQKQAKPPVDRASHLDIYSTTKKPKAEAKGSPEDAAEAKSAITRGAMASRRRCGIVHATRGLPRRQVALAMQRFAAWP